MAVQVKSQVEFEIAHILFIDTVGYSKLTIDDQREQQQLLNQIVRDTTSFRAAEAAGKLVRLPTGDGMALVFAEDVEAPLRCAVEIGCALRSRPTLPVRMGIHSGPISRVVDVNDRVNIAGAGVNIAQRVMSCGDASHILLSQRVADDLAPYRHWHDYLHSVGPCEIKHGGKIDIVSFYSSEAGNPAMPRQLLQARREQAATRRALIRRQLRWVAAPVLIAAVVGLLLMRRSVGIPSERPVPQKSIAVLPFENRSEEKANAYLADGIQDEILTRLAKIAELKVISRTSTQTYKSTPANVPEIARQLGVAHILEGSVQKSGDAIRVNVQLIKAANDSHVWAESFDRKLTDIFSVESDIAKTVAERLRAKLTGREEQIISARSTDNPEAYDAYLRGLAYTARAENANANSSAAQKQLRQAVTLDGNFALAWALLSYNDSLSYITATLEPTVALRDEARRAADTALKLQPKLGEALLAKGYYYYACLKDYESAVEYFEQAHDLLPNSSRIPEALAFVARRRGQWDRSDAYFNEAERLDPRNVSILTSHAHSCIASRRFAEAVAKLDQVLDVTPDDLDTLALKAAVAQAEGALTRAGALLAPLHAGADHLSALETQVYQAILERRPAPMIIRLNEVLDTADPALKYLNGNLHFWLGWSQGLAGNRLAARGSWERARDELEASLKQQPENFGLLGDLALTAAALGDKAGALALVQRARDAIPIEKDALVGPFAIDILARVAAQLGERDQAISALEMLLAMPYASRLAANVPLTPALLRLDPMFDALRQDARFEKLINEHASKTRHK